MKKNYLLGLFTFLLLFPVMGWGQQAGSLDRSFNENQEDTPHLYFDYENRVNCAKVLPDGKILVGGFFSNQRTVDRLQGLIRLNPNGTKDLSFDSPISPNSGIVNSIEIQPDGKILVGGHSPLLVRLNPNGSIDSTFNIGLIEERQHSLYAMALQADGKIVIGGTLNFFDGRPLKGIARLNTNGTLDTTFTPNLAYFSNDVTAIAIRPNGKILIGGYFDSVDNLPRNSFAQLNPNGSLDTSFNPRLNSLNQGTEIRTISLQQDGKALIGGTFEPFQGLPLNNLARINIDGTVDTSFNIGTGVNGQVTTLEVLPNGRIIVGGSFGSLNGRRTSSIIRLNSNGVLDLTFNPSKFDDILGRFSVQPDGKILIYPYFGFVDTNYGVKYLDRLNEDGSFDRSFLSTKGTNLAVRTICKQSDQKLLIAGDFSRYNDIAVGKIIRLNPNGNIDTSFFKDNEIDRYRSIYSVKVQADNKILVGGNFSMFNGRPLNGIVRLNSDGTLDTTFNIGTGPNGSVNTIEIQSDGKILIGGQFTSYNGVLKNKIVRLNPDGSIDLSFNIGTGASEVFDHAVNAITVLPDGKIIIAGKFTTFNGTNKRDLVRLHSDGRIDTSFDAGTGLGGTISSLSIQSDGKLIIGGYFGSYNSIAINNLARINSNGSLDTSFSAGLGLSSDIGTILIQRDGKILIGGYVATYNGVPTGGIKRLNNNGSVDSSFNTGTGFEWIYSAKVSAISEATEGNILVGGEFISFNGIGIKNIAQIHTGYECVMPSSPTITGNSTFCSGNSTVLTSSAITGNLWSTGDTTRSITVTNAGNYSVRVISSGCTSAVSNPITVIVNSPAAPQIAFDTVGNRCLGSEVMVSVAGTYNQYRWNNGATTRSITVRGTGQYSVEVLDSTGCWSIPSRTANIVFDTAFCVINISIVGIDSLEASIDADRYEWFLNGIQLLSDNNNRRIAIQGDGTYTVRGIIGSRNSALSNPITISSSKKSIAKEVFKLYPNPATDKVMIKTTGSGTLEILNTLGQVVITQPTTETNEINISKLANGFYTVRFNSGSKILVVK